MPKISVIVPVYNVEPYIERCARSLFEQTLDDIEYIFVNDCTPDRSMEILSRVLVDYPYRKEQVRIIEMPLNSGQAEVRKVGINAATGDYIIHCDSDDWVDCTIYEKMWRKAVDENFDMVVCGCILTDGEKTLSTYLNEFSVSKDLRHALIANEVHNYTWNKLIRRELFSFVEKWPERNLFEDAAIIAPIAFNCKSIGFVDEALYYYFKNPHGICSVSDNIEGARQMVANTDIVVDYVKAHSGVWPYRKEILHRKCYVKTNCWNLSWKEYMRIYPEVVISLLFDKYLPLDKKLGHISKCFGVHGLFRK